MIDNRESRPAWGVWIEIIFNPPKFVTNAGRAPHGACGLKFYPMGVYTFAFAVAPRMGRVD